MFGFIFSLWLVFLFGFVWNMYWFWLGFVSIFEIGQGSVAVLSLILFKVGRRF